MMAGTPRPAAFEPPGSAPPAATMGGRKSNSPRTAGNAGNKKPRRVGGAEITDRAAAYGFAVAGAVGFTSSSSMSKIRVAPGGMPPLPLSP